MPHLCRLAGVGDDVSREHGEVYQRFLRRTLGSDRETGLTPITVSSCVCGADAELVLLLRSESGDLNEAHSR